MKKITYYPQLFRDWLLANNQPGFDTDSKRPKYYFFFCLIFYCLYLILMQSDWVLGGEMWAEAATNYYPSSLSPSLAVKFFLPDAGYFPLPQHLLAFFGSALNLPARTIPYFYTWSAIVLTAALVGTFCLAPFRALIKSDLLRLFSAMAVLLVADFETRTFINFTYFVAFFVAIISALAFTEASVDVPKWSWAIPILMLSKPASLSVLPAMIVVSFVSRRRFKLITIATAFVCAAQATEMIYSPVKLFIGHTKYTHTERAAASIEYFFGLFGELFTGNTSPTMIYHPIFIGIGLCAFCLLVIFKTRTSASTVILLGLSLMFFNSIVHCIALAATWNLDMVRLSDFHMGRYIAVSYSGIVLVVAGLIASVSEGAIFKNYRQAVYAGPAIFLAWFFFSGWFTAAGALNRLPEFPVINNSQWQTMADAIDSKQPVCVPIDPLDMMFQRDCRPLNSGPVGYWWPKKFNFVPMQIKEGHSVFEQRTPSSLSGSNLISLAIILKPQSAQMTQLYADAFLLTKDGSIRSLSGSRQLPTSGGLVMLTGEKSIPVNEIETVHFQFSTLVDLGLCTKGEGNNAPCVFWLGN